MFHEHGTAEFAISCVQTFENSDFELKFYDEIDVK